MIHQYPKGKGEKISEHFCSGEFDCHCMRDDCKVTYVDKSLIAYLEKKRELWGKPIHIISGFRCTAHNSSPAVGGAPGSRHLIGMAADIDVDGKTGPQLAHDCQDAGGLGTANNWIHVDMRLGKSRWKYDK